MKNLIYVFLMLLLFSCNNEKEVLEANRLSNLDDILADFNEGKLPQDKGEIKEASVYLRATTDNMLIVYVESENGLAYILQMEELPNPNFEVSISNAQVIFLRDQLLVNSLENGEKYLLSLKANEGVFKNMDIKNKYMGYGLGRYHGFSSSALAVTSAVTRSDFGTPGAADGPTCLCELIYSECEDPDAGGPGSTGCSIATIPATPDTPAIAGCSVTCGGASFACCNRNDD